VEKGQRRPQPRCKACASAYYYSRAEQHKKAVGERRDRQRRENQAAVYAYLLEHACVDCGETDPVVLEFDHVWGKKRRSISLMVHNGASWAAILAEIAKCQVRCANDHRRASAHRGNHFRYAAALQPS
jgi:hypothetical protein